MTLFRLTDDEQREFLSKPEVFQGIQLGYFEEGSKEGYCIVISGVTGIIVDANLNAELDTFSAATWRLAGRGSAIKLAARYLHFWENLPPIQKLTWIDTTRVDMLNLLTAPNPPHPLHRPSLTPGASRGRGPLPPIANHLPYTTLTKDAEVFYRWEAWPTSKRINQNMSTIAPWTFVSPASELPFAPTGFSAVSRMALPSFFPAMFRWRVNPEVGSSILCGAIVPMFGQAGGGVEACFDQLTYNDGPLANPVTLEPL